MDNFNLTEFLSTHWKKQLLKEDFRVNTKYVAGKGKGSGKKFIPQHFDIKPRALEILKREGAKIIGSRGILALPLDLYQILNIKNNRVADDIKYTFPRGQEIQASGLVTAIKKSLDRDKTLEMGGKKYYVLNGTLMGDFFRIPSPYKKEDLTEWEYDYEEDEMDDVESRLADEPDQTSRFIKDKNKDWKKASKEDLIDIPTYRLNEERRRGVKNGRKL